MNQELDDVWISLELTIDAIETGKIEWQTAVETIAGALYMLLSHSPGEIIEKILASRFPARGFVSWIVFESQKIDLIPAKSVETLCAYWNENHGPSMGPILPAAFLKVPKA